MYEFGRRLRIHVLVNLASICVQLGCAKSKWRSLLGRTSEDRLWTRVRTEWMPAGGEWNWLSEARLLVQLKVETRCELRLLWLLKLSQWTRLTKVLRVRLPCKQSLFEVKSLLGSRNRSKVRWLSAEPVLLRQLLKLLATKLRRRNLHVLALRGELLLRYLRPPTSVWRTSWSEPTLIARPINHPLRPPLATAGLRSDALMARRIPKICLSMPLMTRRTRRTTRRTLIGRWRICHDTNPLEETIAE